MDPLNRISIGILIAAVLQMMACASAKSKDAAGTSGLGAAVASQPMDFSAQGSDSQKIFGLSTIHFPFNSASMPEEEVGLVTQNAGWIKAHPDFKIQLEGHCDERGSVEYNLALGERRAKAIYNVLVEEGVSASRLSVISYGEERPLVQGETEEVYAKNRRVNFVPLSTASNIVGSVGK